MRRTVAELLFIVAVALLLTGCNSTNPVDTSLNGQAASLGHTDAYLQTALADTPGNANAQRDIKNAIKSNDAATAAQSSIAAANNKLVSENQSLTKENSALESQWIGTRSWHYIHWAEFIIGVIVFLIILNKAVGVAVLIPIATPYLLPVMTVLKILSAIGKYTIEPMIRYTVVVFGSVMQDVGTWLISEGTQPAPTPTTSTAATVVSGAQTELTKAAAFAGALAAKTSTTGATAQPAPPAPAPANPAS
jgi:hypothetical protein